MSREFQDPAKEKAFMKEIWFQMKPTALATSFFFLIAWVLVVALSVKPIATYNEVNLHSFLRTALSV